MLNLPGVADEAELGTILLFTKASLQLYTLGASEKRIRWLGVHRIST